MSDNTDAMFNLGYLYYTDEDGEMQAEGMIMINRAMEKGNLRAKEFLVMNDLIALKNNYLSPQKKNNFDNLNDRE